MTSLTPPPETAEHSSSVTISPIHLIISFFEVTAEHALENGMAVALVAGAGSIDVKLDANGADADEQFFIYEVGAQFRYYVLGDFNHGMQVGIEALHMGVKRETDDDVEVSGEGTSVGPFLGYKFASDLGFTIDLQLGAQLTMVTAKASNSTDSSSMSDSETGPLLNLNVGWSF